MPTSSDPSSEFYRVVKGFVEDTKAINNNKNKQQQQHKCVKEAEAAVSALRQHKAAESSSPPPSSEGSSTSTSTTANNTTTTPSIIISATDSTAGKGGEDFSSSLVDAPMPQTSDEAIDRINKLKAMRDSLLEEKSRNDKFVERYKAKVEKQERMATLRNLVPRQLFVREDRYNEELEKVYKWSGISDQDIADIYRRKLGDIRQHGASINIRDPYRNFRDVPDFSKAVNGKSMSSTTASEVIRNLEFMKKIAGGGGNN